MNVLGKAVAVSNYRSPSVLARYPELRRVFAKHLARFGNPRAAAAHCRLSHELVQEAIKADPDFASMVEQAKAEHHGGIEEAIRTRAIDGWEETKYSNLGPIGTVTRYSDTLLLAYAKRHIPEYRERATLAVSAQVEHKHAIDLTQLTTEQRVALRLLLGTSQSQRLIQVEPATHDDDLDAHRS